MAYGDSKPSRGGGGGSYGYMYDDQGRGRSKSRYEEFVSAYENVPDDMKEKFLSGELEDYPYNDLRLANFIEGSTSRYNVHDWAWKFFADDEQNDGRVRRLIVEKHSIESWHNLQAWAKRAWEDMRASAKKARAESEAEHASRRAAFEAERILQYEEENAQFVIEADLIAGTVYSDFDNAHRMRVSSNMDEGDWIDDPVSLINTGYGYAVESKQSTGLKLHINLALDTSNSMINNGINKDATKTFVLFHLVLRNLVETYDDITAATFEFSDDGYETSDAGKIANLLSDHNEVHSGPENFLGKLEKYRNSRYNFHGTDTWFYPLLKKLREHEKRHNLLTTRRIDLVITDAVFEHKTDGSKCNEIQYKRGYGVTTIFLNFLSETQRVSNVLPLNCIEYGVDSRTIDGTIRRILSEVAGVSI